MPGFQGLPGSMPCTKYLLPALKVLVITNLLFVYKLHSYFPIFIVGNLQLIKSSRGRYQLVHNGFIYNTDRQSGQRVFWRCSEYQRIGCRGRVVTVEGQLLEKCSTHNHESQDEKIREKKAMAEIKEQALLAKQLHTQLY